jgi:hypothetical protein
MAQTKIIARMYKIRIYQPGFGPRIISAFMSDLQAGDLSTQTFVFVCPGGTANLLPGYTNYLAGDMFFDPTSGGVWGCTKAGSNTSSTWQQISGSGSGGGWILWNNQLVQAGTTVRVAQSGTIGGVIVTPGTYFCVQNVGGSGSGNQIPQYPEPTVGTVYYRMVSLGPQLFGICTSSGQQNIYINASAPL